MAFLGKTGLILSAGMLLAGGILFSVGAANGGIRQVEAMAANGELSIGDRNFFYPYPERSANYTVQEGAEAVTFVVSDVLWDEVSQVAGLESLEQEQAVVWWEYGDAVEEVVKKEDVEDMVIDCKSINGELSLYFTDSDYFLLTQEDFFYELNGSTLEISPKQISGGVVYIPAGWVGEKIEILAGAGYIYAEGLQAEEIEVKVGAGYVRSESIQAETLDLAISTGSMELMEVLTENAEIEIGMGNVYIADGTITGDLNVDCGMGELTMYLEGKESDHNYEVSSAGSCNIGNYSHSGVHNHYEIDNDASSDFHITCGLGSIMISFEDFE